MPKEPCGDSVKQHVTKPGKSGAMVTPGLLTLEEQLHYAERDEKRVQWKLDTLADQYKQQEHDLKLARMALNAANEKEEYWAFEPDRGAEQLTSLVDSVPVHIPAGWLKELLAEAKTEGEAGAAQMRGALGLILDCRVSIEDEDEDGNEKYVELRLTRDARLAVSKALSTTAGRDFLEHHNEAEELLRDYQSFRAYVPDPNHPEDTVAEAERFDEWRAAIDAHLKGGEQRG